MAIPYIGSKISLITTSDIRYEGILHTLNREEATIAVQNVRSFGTEGRQQIEVPMSNEIYDYIIFRGKDLKDLTVLQGASENRYTDCYGAGPEQSYDNLYGGSRLGSSRGGMGFPHEQPCSQFNGNGPTGGLRSESPCPAPPGFSCGAGAVGSGCLSGTSPVDAYSPAPFRQPPPPLEPAAVPACVPETRARGKTPGQKKQLSEVLRQHKRAEEIIVKTVRSSTWSTFTPAVLRSLSETVPSVYHFYLDYINDCCIGHLGQTDEQQWELLCKALKKHFEKDFSPSQPQKPVAPARPNSTLGDFIMIQPDSRAAKKAEKKARNSTGVVSGSAKGRGNGNGGSGAALGMAAAPNGALGGIASATMQGALKGEKDSSNKGSSWSCPRCTFSNEISMEECAMCGTSKAQVAMLAEFPPL